MRSRDLSTRFPLHSRARLARGKIGIDANELFFYQSIEETLLEDYRFKIVFNFTAYRPIRRHYLSLSAFEVLTLDDLQKLAEPHLAPGQNDLSDVLKRSLCRPGSLWQKELSI